ncbi:hypothetical protein FKM82_021535 [Ascaphus truei]
MMRDPLLPGSVVAALPGASLQKACRFLVVFCALHLSITLIYYVSERELNIFQYFTEHHYSTSSSSPLAASTVQSTTRPHSTTAKEMVELLDCPETSPLLGKQHAICSP